MRGTVEPHAVLRDTHNYATAFSLTHFTSIQGEVWCALPYVPANPSSTVAGRQRKIQCTRVT